MEVYFFINIIKWLDVFRTDPVKLGLIADSLLSPWNFFGGGGQWRSSIFFFFNTKPRNTRTINSRNKISKIKITFIVYQSGFLNSTRTLFSLSILVKIQIKQCLEYIKYFSWNQLINLRNSYMHLFSYYNHCIISSNMKSTISGSTIML